MQEFYDQRTLISDHWFPFREPVQLKFVLSLLSIGPMSHVDLKKWPCCHMHVEFRGQGPPGRSLYRPLTQTVFSKQILPIYLIE